MNPTPLIRSARSRLGVSIRARITLLYGGVFTAITTAVLIAAQRVQQRNAGNAVHRLPDLARISRDPCDQRRAQVPCSLVPYRPSGGEPVQQAVHPQDQLLDKLINDQRLVTLIAIVVIAVLAFAVCWWITGRLLRPLHHITATARRLSLSTLYERISLAGPQHELKDLADTFDAMLDRLERAADSQRRFVADASHELRTPLAIQRAAIEIGLADPPTEEAAGVRAELLDATLRSERLIEGLLVLAHSEQGLGARAPVDLATVINQAISDHRPRARADHITLTTALRPVTVLGDETLLVRLVSNLVQNSIRHNHPGGRVHVELSPGTGLAVANTGPPVPPDRIGELFEPFRRLHPDRTSSADGAGLGLSIVTAITNAHNGRITATPNLDGGLTVTVTFPTLHPAGAS